MNEGRPRPPGWPGASIRERLRYASRANAGVTAIEYGLIAALVAVAIITALTAVGSNMITMFNTISNKL